LFNNRSNCRAEICRGQRLVRLGLPVDLITAAAKMAALQDLPTAASLPPRATSILPPRLPALPAGALTTMRSLLRTNRFVRSRLSVLRTLVVRLRLLGPRADTATCRRFHLVEATHE
jgi:hypothetical protein